MKQIKYKFYFKIILLSLAEILKPSTDINPKKVVIIQLSALMKNDNPYKDHGIIQTWEFAHPNNQKVTGPIERFKKMLKTDSYSMLLNHSNHEIMEVYMSNKVATFEVTVLDSERNITNLNGKLKNTIEKVS